ncbi:MAG: AAA family ATPase [Pseudomonadota bacterium]
MNLQTNASELQPQDTLSLNVAGKKTSSQHWTQSRHNTMKISKIYIKDSNQFKNFMLDLTYPKGHKKEGQALDKICFIGQSGTGKTSLLNICKATLKPNQTQDGTKAQKYFLKDITITCDFKDIKTVAEIKEGGDIVWHQSSLQNPDIVPIDFIEKFYADKNILIYFPAEIVDNVNRILQEQEKNQLTHPFDYLKTDAEIRQNLSLSQEKRKVFDFEKENFLEIWTDILKNVNDYKVEELKYGQQIANAFTVSTEKGENVLEKFKRWKQENPNPIEKLAQKLDPILNKFCLAIKTSFDFQSIEDLKFIKIQSVGGTEIPYQGWSTGTKQFILTTTPLYQLNTEETIILVDEPERSLYPDIQTEIIDYYTGLAPGAQFFFATHSPIIASAFEPWEIVELKFNEQGTVYQEQYYEGERQVDNYLIDPRYLRWDSILMRVFDLEKEGNETRSEALEEACLLKAKLKKFKEENRLDTEEGQKMMDRFEKLGKKLAWRL